MNDLSSEITAFVISSGNNPNYPHCLDALNKQTVKCKINIIKDYRPMSVAFQEMLNRCDTKHFIEVDEDMVLEPHAIETMYEGIKQAGEKVAMIGYRLHDTHYDFVIYGVKIYKFDIFKNYPYNVNSMSCEMEQLERMQKDGYTYDLKLDILGKHSPYWTNELIYDRYFNLMEKFKEFGYVWMEGIPKGLFEKFKKEPTELNLYAILGAYTSLIHPEKIQQGEKDFTSVRKKEITRMESFLNDPITTSFYLTSKCNFGCSFCRRQLQDISQPKDMELSLVGDILRRFPTIQSVCCAGQGEPLLCDNFMQILQYLREHNIFVGLVTNGSLLKFNIQEMSKWIPQYISVSLNAPNEEVHHGINGTYTFNDVITGIESAIGKTKVYLSYVCTKNNLNHIPEFLKLAKSLKVDSVHLHNLVPHFKDSDDEVFWKLVLTTNDKELVEEMKRDANASIVSRFPVLINRNEIRRECKFPWKMLNFDGDGNISICPSVCEPRKENGHIKDHVIWHNKYCMDLRDSIVGEQKSYCKKCFRNWESA